MNPSFSTKSRIAALERENKHLRDTPTSYACMILADVRHKTGVNEKPMLSELADAILARFESERKKGRERIEELESEISEAIKWLKNGIEIDPRMKSKMGEYFGLLRGDVEKALKVLKEEEK